MPRLYYNPVKTLYEVYKGKHHDIDSKDKHAMQLVSMRQGISFEKEAEFIEAADPFKPKKVLSKPTNFTRTKIAPLPQYIGR